MVTDEEAGVVATAVSAAVAAVVTVVADDTSEDESTSVREVAEPTTTENAATPSKKRAAASNEDVPTTVEAATTEQTASDDGVELDDVDPWASEDDTSDDGERELLFNRYCYGNEYSDSEMEFEDYLERRRIDQRKSAAKAAKFYLEIAQKPLDDAALKDETRYCLHWLQCKQQIKKIVAKMPREWCFLIDWIYSLNKRMRLEDRTRVDSPGAVRIGRDGPDDWWIDVLITGSKLVSSDSDNRANYMGNMNDWDHLSMKQDRRYRMIRESLIFQSMMAQVDYDAWLEALLKVAGFAPPAFMHLHETSPGAEKMKLPARFSLTFPSTWDVIQYEWSPWLKELFDPNKDSTSFRPAYCQAYQTMTAKGFNMEELTPVPIKLRFAPQHCGYLRQIAILKAIMHLIAKIKKVEERWRKRRQWRACPQLMAPPILYLESLDLDLREFTIYPSVLNTVEKLIATAGVRIENLTLPGREFDGVYEEYQLRSAWASLACTAFGINDFRQGSKARVSNLPGVDRLVVPSFYMYGQYYVPFFMAARDACGVKSVRVEIGDMLTTRRDQYDTNFGALLAYAFFSKHSQSSVLDLDIDAMAFSKRTMEAFERVVSANEPLAQVYKELTGSRSSENLVIGRKVSLKMGTPLTPCWGSSVTKTPGPWTSIVVRDDTHEATMTLYVPGFGLCNVNRSHIPIKKQKTARTSGGTQLPVAVSNANASPTVLCKLSVQLLPGTTDNQRTVVDAATVIHRLAKVCGNHLEAFRFGSDMTTEETLSAILENFKKLHSLGVIDATLEEISGFAVAYHQGCQISSLDLSGCQIPMVVFKSLLRWLTTDKVVKATLHRLRIGKDWKSSFLTKSTVELIKNMLKENKQLTHLHINIPETSDMWSDLSQLQGEKLPKTTWPLRHRLAFMSVLRSQNNSAAQSGSGFDQVLITHILGFVAPTHRRTVIVESPPPPPVVRDPYLRLMDEM